MSNCDFSYGRSRETTRIARYGNADCYRRISCSIAQFVLQEIENFQMNWSEEGRNEMYEMTKHLSISLVMNDVKALLHIPTMRFSTKNRK